VAASHIRITILKMALQALNQIHRAVLPTGAANGYSQVAAVVGFERGYPTVEKGAQF
jgi:hypothetical protein